MAKLKIFLNKDQINKEGLSIVYFQLEHKGERFRISTKIKVKPAYWNPDSENKIKGGPFASENNHKLLTYILAANKVLHELEDNFSFQQAKKRITEIFKPVHTEAKPQTFIAWFEQFMAEVKEKVTHGTWKHYSVLKNTLVKFAEKNKWLLEFDSMDKEFLESFIDYLFTENKLLNNTVAKRVSHLKTFLKWAEEDQKLLVNKSYKKFRWQTHDIEPIYLTESELTHFYNFPLTGTHEKVRDLFCFGCYTGLRFSDIQALSEANIKNDSLHVFQQKTKDKVSVPLNQYSRAILAKYDKKLPKISNQKANDYLKEAAKLAGLDSPEKKVQYRGIKRIETHGPKHELIHTHCARATFIIIMLTNNTPPRVIMSMTGHKDYKTFEKYIRIADSVAQDAMKKVWG